jgi:hypothetical protein
VTLVALKAARDLMCVTLVLQVSPCLVLVKMPVSHVCLENLPTNLVWMCAWTAILVALVTPLPSNSASNANQVPISLVTEKPLALNVSVVRSPTTLALRLAIPVWLVLPLT